MQKVLGLVVVCTPDAMPCAMAQMVTLEAQHFKMESITLNVVSWQRSHA